MPGIPSGGPVGPAIRLLIVDDDATLLESLGDWFESVTGLELVGLMDSVGDMLDQHSRLNPDLVIMDVMMPGSNGFEGAYALKQCRPSTKIILLPTYSLPDRVLYPHVDAFDLKSELAEFLLPTIRALFPDRVLGAMGGPERNGGRLG